MQKDKFLQATQCLETASMEEPIAASTPLHIGSPMNIRKGSAAYWKAKYEALHKSVDDVSASSKEISLDEIPGFLHVKKVQPKRK